MNFYSSLKDEISIKVQALAEQGRPMHPSWISNDICNDHDDGLNADSDDAGFWRQGAYHAVRSEVGSFLRRHYSPEKTAEDGGQQTLAGFEHVQTHYIVERNGDEQAVPTIQLSDEEIDAIASRIIATGNTLLAHGEELMRFKASREPGMFDQRATDGRPAA